MVRVSVRQRNTNGLDWCEFGLGLGSKLGLGLVLGKQLRMASLCDVNALGLGLRLR